MTCLDVEVCGDCEAEHMCGECASQKVWHMEPDDSEPESTESLVKDLCALESDVRETVRFGIDSGAAVTVINKDVAMDYPLKTDKPAMKLRAAGGNVIPHHGDKAIGVHLSRPPSGRSTPLRMIRTSVAGVSKNLMAVSALVDADHTVVFSKQRSYIKNQKTGEILNLERVNGVYEVEFDVVPFSELKTPSHPNRGQVRP